MSFYVATLFALTWLGFPLRYWVGLISAVVASAGTIAIFEHGRWNLGLFVPPRVAVRELGIGLAWGVALIGACALLIVLSTDVRHDRGRGFPWLELIAVYIPAVFHEELLFRGYPLQKLLRVNRAFAILFVAVVFAALHAGNTAVTVLGITNVFLGGIFLGLAYEHYHRLWFPLGIHLAWNLMSGPILGHEVSGYGGEATILLERGSGPAWLTGGEFGIEGSVWMTMIELAAVAWMIKTRAEGRRQKAE